MSSFLEYLKESPDCLYIYNRDFSIYGLPSKERYTVIVKDGWICPEEYADYDDTVYNIRELNNWFDSVLHGDLIGWECACLNKKYIIKEHVKLLMTTNPLQLRKNIDSYKNIVDVLGNTRTDLFFNLVKDIRFAIQIIQNHKIINYKEAASDYNLIKNAESLEELEQIVNKPYEVLKSLTDGMIKQEILKKANAKKV